MLYCTQCGYANIDSAKVRQLRHDSEAAMSKLRKFVPAEGQFCILCGARLAESDAPSPGPSADHSVHFVLRTLMPEALAARGQSGCRWDGRRNAVVAVLILGWRVCLHVHRPPATNCL